MDTISIGLVVVTSQPKNVTLYYGSYDCGCVGYVSFCAAVSSLA